MSNVANDRNRRVKEVVPSHKLHSFNLEDGFGWEQLCSALGRPIPDVPYPKANTPARFDKMQAGFVRRAMRKAYALAATAIFVPAVATAAWYLLRDRPVRSFAALRLPFWGHVLSRP